MEKIEGITEREKEQTKFPSVKGCNKLNYSEEVLSGGTLT